MKFRYILKHRITGMVVDVIFEYFEVFNGLCKFMLHTGLYRDYIVISNDEITGLKDRKGKEIYACDIVKYNAFGGGYKNAVILWHDEAAHWIYRHDNDLKDMAYHGHSASSLFAANCEVIGNTHQNPELL